VATRGLRAYTSQPFAGDEESYRRDPLGRGDRGWCGRPRGPRREREHRFRTQVRRFCVSEGTAPILEELAACCIGGTPFAQDVCRIEWDSAWAGLPESWALPQIEPGHHTTPLPAV